MQKIPTIFLREHQPGGGITDQVNPECQWVFDGEGVATRKFDGTCVMFDGTDWWGRREVKPGKKTPANYVALGEDPNTGKVMGWEPIAQSPWHKVFDEARENLWLETRTREFEPVTYELMGPSINGNPERFGGHVLVPHGRTPLTVEDGWPADPVALVRRIAGLGWEGIVWWHPDGRRAKLKVHDLP